MRMFPTFHRLFFAFPLLCSMLSSSAAMTVGNLRCEYAVNPVGIATTQPRLSWTLHDDGTRGQFQTAYQIRVADSREALESATPLWDTGKTVSGASVHIVYGGKPLRSGMRCFWQVRAWDKQGNATPWSEPATWQVALLDAADWQAKWIGVASSGMPDWADVTIILDAIIEKEAFGIVFRAQDNANGYMWQLNNALGPDLLLRPHVQKNGNWSMLPAVSLRPFIADADALKPHRIEIETRGAIIRTRIDGKLVDERIDATFTSGTVGFRTDSKEHARIDSLTVTDAAGKPLLSEMFDKASPTFPKAKLENGQLLLNGGMLLHQPPLPKDCPRLRKTFTLDKPVRHATASVCGLGFYELYLNGKKADGRVLAPPNTPYGQRLLFDTVDVTPLVTQGANAIGLWLAAGYSDDYSQWGWKWELPKRAILQIDIVHDDGTSTTVTTDESWRTGSSPLTFASLYDGEVFDAASEAADWSATSFDAADWPPARVLAAPSARLLPNTMPPLRVMQTFHPAAVTEPKPGVFVFDMGQNFAGWTRLRAKGPRGTRITLRHSELTGADGMIDPWTNRRAKATDTFILAGTGSAETYEPRFTYHGFRYVEVTGYPGRPSADDITGCAVHADVTPAGTFLCSDATLNKIQSNCLWSMRSNFVGIPTDCPQRDERTPCQMDSLAYEDTAFCNFWMNAYYAKWLDDITGGRGNPDWNGDSVFLPWRLYRHYGDIRILERHYENMRAYVLHLNAQNPSHIHTAGFGDWCPPNDNTWQGYHGDVTDVNTCLYAAIARIVSDTADHLGHTEDAARFARLSDEIAAAFHAARYDAARTTYGDGSQATAILPLAFGIVPREHRVAIFSRLTDTIKTVNNGRLDTGIFGTRYLADVLCDFGEADLALSMLTQPEYPGFGFQLANGATTLWEQWSFKGGMNSHNHAMFAGVASSFYTRLAGITALKPGFAEIGIRPVMPKSLSFAEATQETIRGRVTTRWERKNGHIEVTVTLPVNTTARIALPVMAKPPAAPEGCTFIGMEADRAVYTAGSGAYSFILAE